MNKTNKHKDIRSPVVSAVRVNKTASLRDVDWTPAGTFFHSSIKAEHGDAHSLLFWHPLSPHATLVSFNVLWETLMSDFVAFVQ